MSTPMLVTTTAGAVGSGTSAATAEAVSITCGFKPKYVCVVVPGATTTGIKTEWYYGMNDAYGIQSKNDTGAAIQEITADGITVSETGFTIGTACQIDGAVYRWIALG